MPKVTVFANMYELKKSDTARGGTTSAASLSRYVSLGNGGVGDKALATLSHASVRLAMMNIVGPIFLHNIVSIGSFVLS